MTRLARIIAFIERWEKPFAFGSAGLGFAVDLIIAKRPDSWFVNVLLLLYLFISALIIIRLNVPSRKAGGFRPRTPTQKLIALLVLVFCFGGLSSNLLILYGKTGTASGDALFLVLLLGTLIGNEFLKTKYEQFQFNVAVWYLLLLTYCIIAVPTFLLHTIGGLEFFESTLISLGVAAVFVRVFHASTGLFSGARGRWHLTQTVAIIGGIFLFFNALYVTGSMPPVPLALKQIGIYHSVVRTGTGYLAQLEPRPWWMFWRDTSPVFHVVGSAPNDLYCFSSVFAPVDLSVPIAHRFEHYDAATKAWQTYATIVFPISGGRAEGYRGYSMIHVPQAGQWRCDVETMRGDLIGRDAFTVVASSASSTVVQVVL